MPVWAYILVAAGVLTGGASLALAAVVAGRQSAGENLEQLDHTRADATAPTEPQLDTGAGTDDLTALARVLASEDDKSTTARVVVGWITAQKAAKQGLTIYQLVTRGDGYGRQKRPGRPAYYASTAARPREADLDLADGILSGLLEPPQRVKELGIGGWIERGQLAAQTGRSISPAEDAARILSFQWKWDEGIYGRIDNWYLFSKRAPKLIQDYKDAFVLNGTLKDGYTQEDLVTVLIPVAEETLNRVPVIT